MAEPKDTSIIRFPSVVWVLLGVWLLLTTAAVFWAVPHQEQHLTEQAAVALSGSTVTASFEGRDATLDGTAVSEVEVERARATVLTQEGVRTVELGALDVFSAAEAASAEGGVVAIEAGFESGVVTVTGVVPDSATEDAIAAAITQARPDSTVVVDLDVHPSVPTPPWLPIVGAAIGSLDGLHSGVVRFEGSTATVEGEVASEELRFQLNAAITGAVGQTASIDERLVVVAGAPPTMMAVLVDAMLEVGGEMPDRGVIDDLEGNAALVYGPANVSSSLVIGVVGGRDYLETLPSVFSALRNVVSWQAALSNGELEIIGVAPDEATVDEATSELQVLSDSGLELTVEFAVDPAALAASLTNLLSGVPSFELGGVSLSGAAKARLDDAIVLLLENPGIVVIVEGHTDNTGSEAKNLELSADRAQAVVDYLNAGGIEASRLTAVGLGESDPIVSNDTPAGRAANRRIEFVVVLEEEE